MGDKIIIEPNEFKEAFLKVVKNNSNESMLLKLWNSESTRGVKTPYTKYFLNSILANVARELRLQYYKEYWSLDAIFFASKDQQYFTNDKAVYASNISAAVEHENVAKYAVEEINKLAIINASLRVLITYANEDKIDGHLEQYKEIIQDADVFDDFSTCRKFMIIFGPVKKPINIIDWKFFLYVVEGRLKEI